VERLNLSSEEFVCLKAILALDPHASLLSEETSKKLAMARDSVQNALYLQLAEEYGENEAVSRFGRLLMFIANVTVSS
jgi:hypothetical protein